MESYIKKTFLERMADLFGINRVFSKIKEDNIDLREDIVVSPVQGTLVDCGDIFYGEITSKHGRKINLRDLIKNKAKLFSKGFFLNFYLSPRDKHYFRIPYSGRFTSLFTNKGKSKIPILIGLDKLLHSNRFFQKAIKNNASLALIFRTKKFLMSIIPIGSLLVNGIHLFHKKGNYYKKGDALGFFSIGSSMLLCFSNRDKVELLIKKGQKVDIGQAIIRVKD